MLSSKQKGDIGELIVTKELIKKGFQVLTPTGDNARYDLVAEQDGKFYRIQTKTITPKDNKLDIPMRSTTYQSGSKVNSRTEHKQYTADDVDFIVAVDLETENCYYISSSNFNATYIMLRLTAPKNNQRKGVRLAEDYKEFIPE